MEPEGPNRITPRIRVLQELQERGEMVVAEPVAEPVGMSAPPIMEVMVEQEEHRHVRMVEQEELKEMTETQEEMAPMEPMEQRDLPEQSAATVLRE